MENRLKFSLLVIAILLSPQLQAQVKAGLRAGMNYADITNLHPNQSSGFHVGTYLKFSLAGMIELEPGMQYSQRKFNVHPDTPSSHLNLNYVDVPILLRVGVLPFIHIFAGPQASVLLGKRYKGGGQYDLVGSYPKQELGALAGIGVSLPLGINLQGSYDFGLSNPIHNGHQIKNRIFKLSLGKDF